MEFGDDSLDEEIRRELENVSLDDEALSSEAGSPSPKPYPHTEDLQFDVTNLFECYQSTLNAESGHVTSVLTDARHTLDLTQHHSVSSPDSAGHVIEIAPPVNNLSDSQSELEQVVSPLTVCDGLEQFEVEHKLTEQRITDEQLQRENALNILIEETQRKLREKEQVLLQRESLERESKAKAVLILQAHVRGHLVRQTYRITLDERHRMATLIQAVWRGHRARKVKVQRERAITTIQRCWRKRRRLKTAAVCIQNCWRQHREVMRMQERVTAASLIQTWWRRCQRRKQKSPTKEEAPVAEVTTSDLSPSKLTITRRIQTALKLTRQTSDHQLTIDERGLPTTGHTSFHQLTIDERGLPTTRHTSVHQLTIDGRGLPTTRQTRSSSLPCQKHVTKSISKMDWSQLKIDKNALSAVLNCDHKPDPNTSTVAGQRDSNTSSTADQRDSNTSTVADQRDSNTSSTADQRDSNTSSTADQRDSNTSSTADQRDSNTSTTADQRDSNTSTTADQRDSNTRTTADQRDSNTSTVTDQRYPNANTVADQHDSNTSTTADQRDYNTSTTADQCDSNTNTTAHPVPANPTDVSSESLALQSLKESREREEGLAQMSRIRMSSLISEEEIQQVAKQKRSHDTYHNELEFAAQPLSSKAWVGLVSERLEQWKARHTAWVTPSHHTPLTPSPHTHPAHKGTPLTTAQMVAASPKGTPLDRVAMVMMYRSRFPIDLSSLTKCPQLASLSLTKCGLVSLAGLHGCRNLTEVKVQSNCIEHLELQELPELRFADLSDNRLASIHGLQSCSNMLTLDLCENRLARLAGLDGCHRLQRLSVDSNLIINAKGLSSLPLLQWLSCSENHLPRVEGLEGATLLQHVNLSQNNLQRPPMLCDHVLLRELHLEGNSMSDIGPIAQAWLPLLQTLSLANNCLTELSSLCCMVMLEQLDVSNNSLYDLPFLLQSVRGCYLLRHLVVNGNPVSEEPKLCHYITKTLPSLVTLDDQPLRSKAQLPEVVTSSSVFTLCKRQLSEQDVNRDMEALSAVNEGSPSPEVISTQLKDKVSHCHDYQALLIRHLREQECLVMCSGSASTKTKPVNDDDSRRNKAAVTLQAAWRGFKGRQRAEQMRRVYNMAATVIQTHYRGYSLRTKLRRVLDNVHHSEEPCEGGVISGDDIDFEQEIIVDYLDESQLDELVPLSPKETFVKSVQKQVFLPGYTLPGCTDSELTYEEWKLQQQQQQQQTNSLPIRSRTRSPPDVVQGRDWERPEPQAAWGSSIRVDDGSPIERKEDCDKVDRITTEWGFQSSSTAELLLKKAARQKKLHTKANKRKKLSDPSVRLTAFRKRAPPPTHVLRAHMYTGRESVAPSSQRQSSHLYQWTSNHTLVHESRQDNLSRGSSGSFLPQLEPHILAGHSPRLVSSSVQKQKNSATSSYPSLKQTYDKQNVFSSKNL